MDASSGRVRDDGRVARRQGRYAALALAVGLAVVLVAGGCSDASPDSPPSGIDELQIPTPSPDPDDFVRGVDNPWLALGPGTTRRYAVTGATTGTLVITVEDATREVAGVATTPVRRTESTGDEVVDYFAQDRRGNVWWFGREGVWLAGEDGAQAGVAMPAAPRLGDGWRAAYDADVVDVRMTVESRDEDEVALDITNPLEPDAARRAVFERGVGLVEEVSTSGPVYLAELQGPPR
jgi:hypothetical protein